MRLAQELAGEPRVPRLRDRQDDPVEPAFPRQVGGEAHARAGGAVQGERLAPPAEVMGVEDLEEDLGLRREPRHGGGEEPIVPTGHEHAAGERRIQRLEDHPLRPPDAAGRGDLEPPAEELLPARPQGRAQADAEGPPAQPRLPLSLLLRFLCHGRQT